MQQLDAYARSRVLNRSSKCNNSTVYLLVIDSKKDYRYSLYFGADKLIWRPKGRSSLLSRTMHKAHQPYGHPGQANAYMPGASYMPRQP